MAIIQASYLHMVGDMFIGEWEFEADVETSLNEVGDPYVSSVSDIKLLQGDGALSIELDSDDQFLATLCRAIQEHCEADESILTLAMADMDNPGDTAGDAAYRAMREVA